MTDKQKEQRIAVERLISHPLLLELSRADFSRSDTAKAFILKRMDEEYIEEWAREFSNRAWERYPLYSPWLAPIRYEEALEEAPNRQHFLAELQNIIDVTMNYLIFPDAQCSLFQKSNEAFDPQTREEVRGGILTAARRGCHHANHWLELRRYPAWKQLHDYVREIIIIPHASPLSLHNQLLAVCAEPITEFSDEHFHRLISHFARELPLEKQATAVLELFTKISALQIDQVDVIEVEAAEGNFDIAWLSRVLPLFRFPRVLEGVTLPDAVNATFWTDLRLVVETRTRWAGIISQLIKTSHSIFEVAPKTELTESYQTNLVSHTSSKLDAHLTPRLDKVHLDQFLLRIGFLEELPNSKVCKAKKERPYWNWAFLRWALQEKMLLDPLTDTIAVEVFEDAYSIGIKRSTMALKPPTKERDHEKYSFYQSLMRHLDEWVKD